MVPAPKKETILFIETPRPTGISSFLIELPNGTKVGGLDFDAAKDAWVVTFAYLPHLDQASASFRHREDAERWAVETIERLA